MQTWSRSDLKDQCLLHWVVVLQSILSKLTIPTAEAALVASCILQAWQRDICSLNKYSPLGVLLLLRCQLQCVPHALGPLLILLGFLVARSLPFLLLPVKCLQWSCFVWFQHLLITCSTGVEREKGSCTSDKNSGYFELNIFWSRKIFAVQPGHSTKILIQSPFKSKQRFLLKLVGFG